MRKSQPKWQLLFLFSGIWTLVGLLFGSLYYLNALSENGSAEWQPIFLSSLLRFYIWAAFSPLIFRLAKRFNFVRREKWLNGAVFHISTGFAFSLFHSLIYAALLWFLLPAHQERYRSILALFQQRVFFGSLTFGILVYSLLIVSIQAFLFYRNFQTEAVRTSQLTAQLSQAELQTLKMQLQPHFLFNTLHSIQSLVLVDPPKANQMIARLGEFLRLTLDHEHEQIVLLQHELEFVRCYLEIEEIRFSDRLIMQFEIEPATLSAPVPHLILQPIIENAVKHAIAPRAAGGRIWIKTQRAGEMLQIQISDNGTGISLVNAEHKAGEGGRGLANVRSRLAQLYNANYSFEMTSEPTAGLTVTLMLPFVAEAVTAAANEKI